MPLWLPEVGGTSLAPYWMMIRTPRERWWELGGGGNGAARAARAGAPVYLRIEADGDRYGFSSATERDWWVPVLANADGRILSTRGAGGAGGNFTGVVVGMYARSAP